MLRRVTSLHEISSQGPLETCLDRIGTRLDIGFGGSLGWIWSECSGLDRGGFGLELALGVTGLVWIAPDQD